MLPGGGVVSATETLRQAWEGAGLMLRHKALERERRAQEDREGVVKEDLIAEAFHGAADLFATWEAHPWLPVLNLVAAVLATGLLAWGVLWAV